MRLSVGLFVMYVQFVEVRSEFCCRVKGLEGAMQEKTTLLWETLRFKAGAGTDCKT